MVIRPRRILTARAAALGLLIGTRGAYETRGDTRGRVWALRLPYPAALAAPFAPILFSGSAAPAGWLWWRQGSRQWFGCGGDGGGCGGVAVAVAVAVAAAAAAAAEEEEEEEEEVVEW